MSNAFTPENMDAYAERTVAKHQFIKTGDPDSHRNIEDSNGEVVLAQCRVCGEAEGGLDKYCPGPLPVVEK